MKILGVFWEDWGVDISNDVGGVKGEVGRWLRERGQGRRFLAFILTLDAAPMPLSLCRERSSDVFSELRSIAAWFGLGQGCMILFHCVVVKSSRTHVPIHLSTATYCGQDLQSRTPACARGRVLTQVSGPGLRPCQAPSFPATRLRWRTDRLWFRRRNIQYRRMSSLRAIATLAMDLPRRSTSLQYTRFNS